MGLYIKEENNSVVFKAKIIPNSSKNEFKGLYNDAIRIKIKAPPVDGKVKQDYIPRKKKYYYPN